MGDGILVNAEEALMQESPPLFTNAELEQLIKAYVQKHIN